MSGAKALHVAPISRADAGRIVKRIHYSGKVVNNSQLHLGVFLEGRLEGAMQFGPSLDKRKIQRLVSGTPWNGFIEINRMAFGERLPRNSESRALGVAFRLMRKHYPHIDWVISFADGTQCGDGTIYRAAGFALTGIKKNTQMWAAPDGETFSPDQKSEGQKRRARAIVSRTTVTKGAHVVNGAASMSAYKGLGFRPLAGYQLRYIYFLNPAAQERLTVPVIPFTRIDEMGASMYRGEKITRVKQATGPAQGPSDGAAPIHTLQ